MKVSLRKKAVSDNRHSLYLDVYKEGKRSYEFLKLYLFRKPQNELDKQHNKETARLAQEIRAKRQLLLDHNDYDSIPTFAKSIDFFVFMDNYLESYKKADNRMISSTINKFKRFLREEMNITSLKVKDLSENICSDFKEYLEAHHTGEGISSYFARFKKIVKQAYKEGLLQKNPCENLTVKKSSGLEKDVLSFEEMQRLANAHCGNPEVRRAFLFSLNTGLRWCDVKVLKWKHIDGEKLKIEQSKTNIQAIIDLNPTSMKLAGERSKPTETVFELPSHTGALKVLKNWVARAGIEKHITWHCARHSFGVSLLMVGTDIKSVSSLLGHTSLKHTEKYTRVVNDQKKKAVNALPEIEGI